MNMLPINGKPLEEWMPREVDEVYNFQGYVPRVARREMKKRWNRGYKKLREIHDRKTKASVIHVSLSLSCKALNIYTISSRPWTEEIRNEILQPAYYFAKYIRYNCHQKGNHSSSETYAFSPEKSRRRNAEESLKITLIRSKKKRKWFRFTHFL